MTSDEAYDVILQCRPQMGANYLIADGVVYKVTMWALGGVADKQTLRPDDPNYELYYRAAANDPHTLYREKGK